MRGQDTTSAEPVDRTDSQSVGAGVRDALRGAALRNALMKRQTGVPTYSVPEAAALLSVSQEHLYRLIQADVFPAVRMSHAGRQGRYVVPAIAVERLLDEVAAGTSSVDLDAWTATYRAACAGGVA